MDNSSGQNLQVKFNTPTFALLNQKTMIKETAIRKQELLRKLNAINDKMKELLGEKTTLIFKVENGAIHPGLAILKEQAIDFEAMLMKDEVEEIKKEYDFIAMIEDAGLDFEKENF